VLARLGVSIDPKARVGTLGMAEQQLVEISRALSRNARFILMDEPTASLTETEIELLFRKIGTLKESGVGILYISHRLEEISRIADRITVMRDGRSVYSGPSGELSLAELIARMVGRPIGNHYPKERTVPGEVLMETWRTADAAAARSRSSSGPGGRRNRRARGRRKDRVGEERLRRGDRSRDENQDRGKRGRSSFTAACPRSGNGDGSGEPEGTRAYPRENGSPNITITILDRISRALGIIDRGRQGAVSAKYVAKLSIKCPSDSVDVSTLSGGNQQKVVLAKWLACEGRIVILDEPTRGIDVGAKLEMYQLINALCREGKGVVLISSDLPELLSMSDRIYVMRQGNFVARLSREEASQERVVEYASGFGRQTI
jgi:ABC-type sugar transport system ATPase subunit